MNEYEILTERLRLRPWREADRPAFLRCVGDPEVMRYLNGGQPWPPERTDDFLGRQARNLAAHGVCMGAVEWRETGAVIGWAGIQPYDVELIRPPLFELGWTVWKDYWRRGVATEAARAFVRHAFEAMQLERITAIAAVDNAPSIRVMEKLGMEYGGVRNAREFALRHPDMAVAYYELRNPALC